ncbi:serine hydrolase [Pleionea sediminis]|uniref:serine hydrolase n=1 Tax=Pleionea sediminis TaxID=2569479 RepID=UPI0011861E8E|nr:serine hydrolase [Pleionea sediminis]
MKDNQLKNRVCSIHSRNGLYRIIGLWLFIIATSPISAIPEVDPQKFEHFVHSRLKDRVKGYSFTLVAPGQTVVDGAGGFAQGPSNGNVPMSTSIVSNIGSVSKVITGVAFLDLIRENRIAEGTVNQQLEAKVADFLPPRLKAQYKNGIKDLTFRDLLIHKSGLIQANSEEPQDQPPSGWRKLEWALQRGTIRQPGTGGIDYNNTNISLMRFIIPTIAYPSETAWIEEQYGDLPDREEYFESILSAYNNMFKNYMTYVFFLRYFQARSQSAILTMSSVKRVLPNHIHIEMLLMGIFLVLALVHHKEAFSLVHDNWRNLRKFLVIRMI